MRSRTSAFRCLDLPRQGVAVIMYLYYYWYVPYLTISLKSKLGLQLQFAVSDYLEPGLL